MLREIKTEAPTPGNTLLGTWWIGVKDRETEVQNYFFTKSIKKYDKFKDGIKVLKCF